MLQSIYPDIPTEEFLKNCPNSATTLYKSGRPNPLRITGKTLWNRAWQSWVFNPCTLFPSALTLLSGLEENPCGNLTCDRTSQNSFLFTLSKTYTAGAISRGLPSSCTYKSCLIPRCVKSILDFKVSFVSPSILRSVPIMLSHIFSRFASHQDYAADPNLFNTPSPTKWTYG